MNQEISTQKPPALAILVQVVPTETQNMLAGYIKDAKGLKISSVEDFKKAGEHMNSLSRAIKRVEDLVKDARAPHVAQANAYTEEGKPFIIAGKLAKVHLDQEMRFYDRIQKEEQAKAEAERQRLLREAARLKAEADAAEAKRLQLIKEAEARQAAAAVAVENAETNEAFEAAAADFDKGLAKVAEAQAVPVVEVPEEILQAHTQVHVPQVFKATGTRTKKTPIIEDFDLAKLPATYLVMDEAKVKRHILDGTITAATPGIKFRIEESFTGSGR